MLNGKEFPRVTVAEAGEIDIVGGGPAATATVADPNTFV
jgi:hypothetical protein